MQTWNLKYSISNENTRTMSFPQTRNHLHHLHLGYGSLPPCSNLTVFWIPISPGLILATEWSTEWMQCTQFLGNSGLFQWSSLPWKYLIILIENCYNWAAVCTRFSLLTAFLLCQPYQAESWTVVWSLILFHRPSFLFFHINCYVICFSKNKNEYGI
jgi:hypothetical protein